MFIDKKCILLFISLKIPFADFSYAHYYGDSYLEFQGLHLNVQNFIHLEFKTYKPDGLLLYVEESSESIGQFLIQLFIRHGILQVRHQNILLKGKKVKFGICNHFSIYILFFYCRKLCYIQYFKENICQTSQNDVSWDVSICLITSGFWLNWIVVTRGKSIRKYNI